MSAQGAKASEVKLGAQGTKVNEVKLSLKLMVDSKAKKVVFAEAEKDFVDFLFHILSLPLATVVKLLNNEEMTGSLPALYKSVESLRTDYFARDVNKDTVLLPKLPITLPLLSYHHTPATLLLTKCLDHNYVSGRRGTSCSYCYRKMSEIKFNFDDRTLNNEVPRFVKEAVVYMVMDNLEVKPMSMTLIKSLVGDFNHLVEKEVQFGLKEGLTLLKASLETNDVLTTVFLGSKRKTRARG